MALKDVIIGYAKGDKGDKGDTGERGATGQTGPQGEPGNIADAAITDTQGLDVAKGTKTTAQKLFDAIADRIVNKLVTNDTLTTKLADYLLKSAMSSTNINSTTNVPTSALVYSLLQDVNNNLSKCLQYIHSETDVFDFNDPKTPAGYHRLGAAASYKNAPSGLDGVNFCTVEVVRPTISDTLAMTIYPYKKGINPPVWYKSGGSNEWPTLPWNVYATKSDLSNMTKKDSSKFMPGDTVLDVSAWSAITLLSIVTYKDEATALYLIRKESSNKIYCIPVKSSTQVSVTHNGENKLTLSNSATYGGTWAVLFLS